MAVNKVATRLMGLSSGMDTESIIKNMMAIQQLKVDKQIRAQTNLQWKGEALKGLKTDLTDFRNTFMSALSPKNLLTTTAFNTFEAKLSGGSNGNTEAVTITTSAQAQTGSYVINSVNSLAAGAKATSENKISIHGTELASTNDVPLGSLQFAGSKNLFTKGDPVISFSINGKTFSFMDTDTLSSMISTINNSEAGVTMTYSRLTDKISFETKETGSSATLKIQNLRGNAFGYGSAFDINSLGQAVGKQIGANFTTADGKPYFDPLKDKHFNIPLEELEKNIVGGIFNNDGVISFSITNIDSLDGRDPKEDFFFYKNKRYEKDVFFTETIATEKIYYTVKVVDGDGTEHNPGDLRFDVNEVIPPKTVKFFKGEEMHDSEGNVIKTTLSDIIGTINNRVGANVTVSFDENTSKVTITSKSNYKGDSFDIRNGVGNLFGTSGNINSVTGIMEGTYSVSAMRGTDAKFMVNGNLVVRESNNFTIDGIGYQLNYTFGETKETNNAADKADDDIHVTISRDVKPAVDKIKEFVDGYNVLIAKLQDLLSEKKTDAQVKYTPLTEAEKEAMTDEQIEKWEEIAKIGLLRNDNDIRALISNLRSSFYDSVAAMNLSPAQIGVSSFGLYSIGYADSKPGQIDLDIDKLTAALERDPNRVMNVFINISYSTDAKTKYNESGLLNRITTLINNYTSGTQSNTLDSIQRSITDITKRITDLNKRLAAQEEKYYIMFAKMEKLLSDTQSQSDWLAGQLGQ